MSGRNRQVSGQVMGEGKGEVPLRFMVESSDWFKDLQLRILTDPVKVDLIHPRTGEKIDYLLPDFAIVYPNGYRILIFDDGGVHSKPSKIDDDIVKTAALSELGFKVVRLQHKKDLNKEKLKKAYDRLQQIVYWYIEPHWIDLEEINEWREKLRKLCQDIITDPFDWNSTDVVKEVLKGLT